MSIDGINKVDCTRKDKKSVWFINEYAMPPMYEARIRNNAMAKYLRMAGYDTTIIGGSELHGTNKRLMEKKTGFIIREYDGQRFVHIGVPRYSGNGLARMIAMVWFQWHLSLNARKIAKQIGRPDVLIYDDWAIPLCPAARMKRIFHAKLIKEVRDLWPESLVAFGYMKKDSLIARYLYRLEKKLYMKSDEIVFAMEGGKDYLIEKSWVGGHTTSGVDPDRIHHICNGVDLEVFLENIRQNPYQDEDLDSEETFKVVYAGSIRAANGLSLLVDTAKVIMERGNDRIRIIVFGDGEQRAQLAEIAQKEGLNNICFKGRVDKKFIPSILSKASLTLLNYEASGLIWKYGQSNNKLFEYFAAGKPVFTNLDVNPTYSIIKRYSAGIERHVETSQEYADTLLNIAALSTDKYVAMCDNARKAAERYDYKRLTNQMIHLIETVRE